jgi:hypothetical protein
MRWSDRIGRRLKLHDLHIFMTMAETGSMGSRRATLDFATFCVKGHRRDRAHNRCATTRSYSESGAAETGRGIP